MRRQRLDRPHRPSSDCSRRHGLGVSLAVHCGLLAWAVGAGRGAPVAHQPPIAFAVEPSLLEREAAQPQPPTAPPPPPVEIEPVIEPTIDSAQDAEVDPTEAVATLPTPVPERTRAPDLADCPAKARIVRKRRPEPPEPTAAPPNHVAAAPPTASDAGAETKPDVPVPIPGHNPPPEYPASARQRRIEGTVLIRIDVDRDGRAAGCRVAQSSGCVALDQAALTAARRWQFVHGPGSVEVPFVFELRRGA